MDGEARACQVFLTPKPVLFPQYSFSFSVLSSDWRVRRRIKMEKYTEMFESEMYLSSRHLLCLIICRVLCKTLKGFNGASA